jgi:hypothetical protein
VDGPLLVISTAERDPSLLFQGSLGLGQTGEELMKMDKSRREFLTRDFFAQAIRFFNGMADSYDSKEPIEKKEDYFGSFEKCYPLLSEAGGLLMEEAIRQGIETKGKSKLEIAKEIFSSQVQSKRIVEKEVK